VKQARQEVVREEQKKAASASRRRSRPGAKSRERARRKGEAGRHVRAAGSTELPELSLLDDAPPRAGGVLPPKRSKAMSRLVELKLRDFGVEAEVVEVHPGPVITALRAEARAGREGGADLAPRQGPRPRIVRGQRARVSRSFRASRRWGPRSERDARDRHARRDHQVEGIRRHGLAAALVLGKDIGATRWSPISRACRTCWWRHHGLGQVHGRQCDGAVAALQVVRRAGRLIMIDRRCWNSRCTRAIPHLLAPVVTDMKQAANALRWCVAEMERRYQLMGARRRAQPRGLQPQGQGGSGQGQADARPDRDERLPPEATWSLCRSSSRCRTSS